MLANSLQLIIVLTPDWSSSEGVLYTYERLSIQDAWILIEDKIPVFIGKNGLAPGSCEKNLFLENQKREGDGKSPAGIFTLGPIFGDPSGEIYSPHMPFLKIEADLECIDDPNSQYYNQFIYTNQIAEQDWTSSEKMREIGSVYDLGIVIGHNQSPVKPGFGSCVFIHIERQRPTPGCTTLKKEDLQRITEWLKESSHPLLIQLPLPLYLEKTDLLSFPPIPL